MQKKNRNTDTDYGIYQFYGYHPAYGADKLLYIGKAQNSTFASRMTNFHDHQVRLDKYSTSDEVVIFLGRLAGKETPNDKDWNDEITWAEKLLIYAHSPALNSQGLNIEICEGDELFDVHVFNWGKHKALLPEVSGKRCSRNWPPGYNLYSKSSR